MKNWDGNERRQSCILHCELILKLETKLDNLIDTLNAHIEDRKVLYQDHESRVRFLERSLWIGFGGLAALNLVLKFLVI